MNLSQCVIIAAAAKRGGGPQEMIYWLGMFAIIGFMIFSMYRSQKKEKTRRQEMLDSIKVGDNVVTAGGIHGEVTSVKEKTFTIKIADNVKVDVSKNGIGGVENKESEFPS